MFTALGFTILVYWIFALVLLFRISAHHGFDQWMNMIGSCMLIGGSGFGLLLSAKFLKDLKLGWSLPATLMSLAMIYWQLQIMGF